MKPDIAFNLDITSKIVIFIKIFLCRREEAVNRPKPEFVPKTLADLHIDISDGISGECRLRSSLLMIITNLVSF